MLGRNFLNSKIQMGVFLSLLLMLMGIETFAALNPSFSQEDYAEAKRNEIQISIPGTIGRYLYLSIREEGRRLQSPKRILHFRFPNSGLFERDYLILNSMVPQRSKRISVQTTIEWSFIRIEINSTNVEYISTLVSEIVNRVRAALRTSNSTILYGPTVEQRNQDLPAIGSCHRFYN